MIVKAKKLSSKAKEMDISITLFPRSLKSKSVKIKDARSSIPEQMGSFKTFFRQADTVVVSAPTSVQVRAPPVSQLDYVTQATTSHLSPSGPDGLFALYCSSSAESTS